MSKPLTFVGHERGEALMALLAEWDAKPVERTVVDDRLRAHLRSLREDAVPPLV